MWLFSMVLFGGWADRETAFYLSGAVGALSGILGFGIGRVVSNKHLAGIFGFIIGMGTAALCIALYGHSDPLTGFIWIGTGSLGGSMSAFASSKGGDKRLAKGVYPGALLRDGRAIVCQNLTVHVDSLTPPIGASGTPTWSGKLFQLSNLELSPGRKYTLEIPGYTPCTIRIMGPVHPVDQVVEFTGIGALPVWSALAAVDPVTMELGSSLVKVLEPYRDEIFQRLLKGETMEQVAADIGKRAGASAAEVTAFYNDAFSIKN